MAKKKNLTVHELAELKNGAFKRGVKAVRGFEVSNLKDFYAEKKLDSVLHDGHVMEVLVAFMLGMIQKVLSKNLLEVEMTEEDDKYQIDFRLNGFPIQQKFDWRDRAKLLKTQKRLWERRILLVNIRHYHPRDSYSIIEPLMDMLRFAELTPNMTKRLSKSPALNASEKIWMWYCNHIKLRDVGLFR